MSTTYSGKFVSYNKEKNLIEIKFPFDYSIIAYIKAEIEGRTFNPTKKIWEAPITIDNLRILKGKNFLLESCLETWYKQNNKKEVKKFSFDQIPKFNLPLYLYQKSGILFLEKRNGRALIADEMGLGKTIQALAWTYMHPELTPVLIVCPAVVKYNWQNEIKKWFPIKKEVFIISGKKPGVLPKADYYIINYDILADWVFILKQQNFQIIITDEAHYYKNNNAKRTKAIKILAKNLSHFIALTGTPITSRPIEFYNVLKILKPTLFPNRFQYAMRYCNAKHNGYGWDFSGASHTEELHKMINGVIMIRHTKQEVLKQLPEKTWNYIPLEIDNKKEYTIAENDLINWLKYTKSQKAAQKAANAEALVRITYLRNLAAKGKQKNVIDWISNFLEDSDQKLVVFGIHQELLNNITKTFSKISVKVDGSVNSHKKQDLVDLFQNNPDIRLFIGNIQAAGVGINLTAASNIAFIELPWTPGELNQAENRCHRIGQKNSVMIHYLLAHDTIDQTFAALLAEKKKVINSVVDGKGIDEDNLFNLLVDKLIN